MNELLTKREPDMKFYRPVQVWAMRIQDIPVHIKTFIETSIPGIALVFLPLQELQEVSNEGPGAIH